MATHRRIRVGVLTSSRADFGIYLPLLKSIKSDKAFDLQIVAFGTHLSPFHGMTVNEIEREGFTVNYRIPSMLLSDSAESISTAYALTTMKFATFWSENQNKFDVVFTLGDRYEMAAAVAAGVPFSIRFAHIHGGETTLGAIDNVYRHSISLSSFFHFTTTQAFSDRLKSLLDDQSNNHYVGSLSLENLDHLKLLSVSKFKEKWGIDLSVPSILITVHPETVDYRQNEQYAREVKQALMLLKNKFQLIITMPNADTMGTLFRKAFDEIKDERVYQIENFGTQSYFTCMKHATLLLGNTSSGIIEAASFGKYVINLGNRQKGRVAGENVIHCAFDTKQMVDHVLKYATKNFSGKNPYYRKNPSARIIKIIKEELL